MCLVTTIPDNLRGGLYKIAAYTFVGLKGDIYSAEATLILSQYRSGEGRVGCLELQSYKKLGLLVPTR